MGGSYSDLNVYLRTKNKHSTSDYIVTSTKKNFEGCCNFVEFTHTISFTNGKSLNYNVLLYDGYCYDFRGRYVFGYYYPGDKNQVIEEVRSYYSVLVPNVPLVISFKRGGNIYNCYFGDLKNAGWDRAYNIDRYSFDPKLTKDVLDEEFKKLLLNRTIKFTTGQENIKIAADKQEIGKQNFRFIFLPKGNESVLGVNCLFSLDFKKNEPKLCESQENKCQIDPYFLASVDGKYYDGIFVYFAGDPDRKYKDKNNKGTVLLLEFIDYRNNNICLRRKDEGGCWWSQEKVNSNDDKKLLDKLNEIKTGLQKDVVTVILDKKEKYEGVSEVPSVDGRAYTKYTHNFEKPNKPVFIFERQEKIASLKPSITAQNVEVYYLKAKDEEDKEPFLIVIEPNDRAPRIKKAYHFSGKYEFKDWVEFKFDLKKPPSENPGDDQERDLEKKLYEKVEKIKNSGRCVEDLPTLRWYAYQILIDKEIPTTKPEDEETPQRPPEQQPSPTTEPLNIPLIAGCTVGGVVFVGSSAVGYGIYWYNTTIKLLT